MKQLTSQWKKKYMKTIINFIKRLPRLYHLKKFNSFKIKPKLSETQIDELFEINKDVVFQLRDEGDYNVICNYCTIPQIEKVVKKTKLHDK